MTRTIDDRDDCAAQSLVRTDRCTRWKCEDWRGTTFVRPQLVLIGKLWTCPKCKASYGEHAKDLPETVNT